MINRSYEMRIKGNPQRVVLECLDPASEETFDLQYLGNVNYDLAALTVVFMHLNRRGEEVVSHFQGGRSYHRVFIATKVNE